METCLVHFTWLDYQIVKPDEEIAKSNRPKTQHNFTDEHQGQKSKKTKQSKPSKSNSTLCRENNSSHPSRVYRRKARMILY